ncbi:MAG: Na+/H+ antiporter NhaC family protein, partial [Rhodothermales bacterium]
SVPYSFYPILAVFFVFNVAWSPKEFGPMLKAERRARAGDVLSENALADDALTEGKDMAMKEGVPHRAVNAILPVVVLVVSVLGGLYMTGEGETLREIIGSADSYRSLMWGSLLSVLTAAGLVVAQRVLTVDETVQAWYAGVKSMLFAMIILVLAWALSEVTTVLHTADYLVSILGESLPPGVIPAIVFVLAAATAFATGTSWGTMGILMPLVVPLSWAVLELNGIADPAHYYLLYSSVSCVLAGAVWGDHCSPISDTTILSSMASGCDHIEHVRTQLPYAVFVGLVAVLLGTLPTSFGFPWWGGMLLGATVLFVGLRAFGKDVGVGR